MMTTRSLDFDLEFPLLLLVVLGNKAPMTRLDKGRLFCLSLGDLSSMTSTMGVDADGRDGGLSWDMMNSEVGSPYWMKRIGCSFTMCISHGSSGYPCWHSFTR